MQGFLTDIVDEDEPKLAFNPFKRSFNYQVPHYYDSKISINREFFTKSNANCYTNKSKDLELKKFIIDAKKDYLDENTVFSSSISKKEDFSLGNFIYYIYFNTK